MFEIPVDGLTKIRCDNENMVENCSKFELVLNKKHNAIACHLTRWAVATKEAAARWAESKCNLEDTMDGQLTKQQRDSLETDLVHNSG